MDEKSLVAELEPLIYRERRRDTTALLHPPAFTDDKPSEERVWIILDEFRLHDNLYQYA